MVQFSKFKLSGFKSFVDATEVEIGYGLNGVVGPNGCGKSNLLEALRWVMGETSAKKMRGAGMEDVIFAGTAQRPPRSMAEVSLILDNHDKTAPEPFTDIPEIQIARRIERDKGSQYKVNGKTVRARDVQMLFADTVSGANSPALVSQGRITAIINAKPHERRHVLEESAGVGGLYTRRHEAELRLRAAEKNLERMDDSMQTSRTQMNSLKRQAGSAKKYREYSEKIRLMEMVLTHFEYQKASTSRQEKNQTYQVIETEITQLMSTIVQDQTHLDKVIADLPELRKQDTALQARYQALRIEQDRLEKDRETTKNNVLKLQNEIEQITLDLKDAIQQKDEAEQNLKDLKSENLIIADRLNTAPQKLEEYETLCTKHQQDIDALERRYQSLNTERAQALSQAKDAEEQLTRHHDETKKYERQLQDFKDSLTRLTDQKDSLENPEEIQRHLSEQQKNLSTLQDKLQSVNEAHRNHYKKHDDENAKLNELETNRRIINGEIDTIEKLLNLDHDKDNQEHEYNNILSQITVSKGFEKALSRALGDLGLQATTSCETDIFWDKSASTQAHHTSSNLNNIDHLEPLSKYVQGPEELSCALNHIFVTEIISSEMPKLLSHMGKGEAIVTKDGDYYRWDGLRIKQSANTESGGQQLEYKNKLQTLKDQASELTKQIESTHKSVTGIKAKIDDLTQEKYRLQNDVEQSKNTITNTHNALTKITNEGQQIDIRIENYQTQYTQAKQYYDDALNDLKLAEKKLQKASDSNQKELSTNLDEMRTELSQKREDLSRERSEYDVLRFQRDQDKQQSTRLAQDKKSLDERLEKLEDKRKNLVLRQNKSQDELNELRKAIEANPQSDDAFHEKMVALEKQVHESSDALAIEESKRADATSQIRELEQKLSSYKEKRAGLTSDISSLNETIDRLKQDIQTQYQSTASALEAKILEAYDNILPDEQDIQNDLVKIKHQRDTIGPVNLRADIEVEELQQSMSELEIEYDDLTEAISQLRKGIAKLNKEARERIRKAFIEVNAHFQKLFARLFNGGNAYLEMIESDDPLEAGLEIFAQPPGKALQSLSLLSGGEQTMASIALIFAMFMTNPSPICVLDEIDAPLDDSNVDRMCDLLEDIAKQGKTRFMVITHHRMTMARMNRLYGVTMSEKGVSKLVSVDLAQQESFINELTA